MHPVEPEEKTTSLRPCQSNARTQETSRLCGAATTRLSDAHLHPDEFEIAKRDQRAVRSRPVTRRDPCCGVHSAWWIYAAPRRRSFRPLRVTDTCARSPGLRSAAKRIDRLRRPRSQNTSADCDGSNRPLCTALHNGQFRSSTAGAQHPRNRPSAGALHS